ncbi:MAG: hypothetical protein ACJ78T_02590, partial [Myxococcales bacterium]
RSTAMSDSLMRMLGILPAAEPDIARSEHIRARCHARLARSRVVSITPPAGLRTAAGRLTPVWQSLIALLGFVYLTAVIRFALDVYGLT